MICHWKEEVLLALMLKIEKTSEFVQMLEKELPEVYNRMMEHLAEEIFLLARLRQQEL